MALTPSNMLPLGTKAPSFKLPDTDGNQVTLDSKAGAKGYLVIFMCNHCPYVKHIRSALAQVTADYMKKGIAVFGINANDAANYPEDSPEKMKVEKKSAGYQFPYLYDHTQTVAESYDAACTPDFYLFDASKSLVYRGQFDDSRPGNDEPVTGKDLTAAVESVLSGKKPTDAQAPSIGCNIKWRN